MKRVKDKYCKEVMGTTLILLTAFFSGMAIIVNKFFVASIDPLIFTSLRALMIGLIFLVVSLVSFKLEKKQKTFKKTSWWPLLLIGIIGGGLAFWMFFSGLKLTLGIRAAFLHKTLPLFATILAVVFLKEKLSKQQWVALGVMLVGLVFMQITVFNTPFATGDILVLFATFLWAIENTIAKKAMLNKESNWVVTFSRMFFGAIFLFAIILIQGNFEAIFNLDLLQWIYVLVSGGFLLIYVLTWYWGLKYINLSKASTILLLAPVISLILGMAWLGEKALPLQLFGSALILIGAYFVVRSKSLRKGKKVESEIDGLI